MPSGDPSCSGRPLPRPVRVLLVEDNPADVALMMAMLERVKVHVDIDFVSTGEEALAFLDAQPPHNPRILPDLILLDLNLPGLDGREVLHEVKARQDLKHIPVVILTTSESDDDILDSYRNFAACYVTKPLGLDQFARIVGALSEFWFTIVRFPEGGAPRDNRRWR